MAECGGGYVVDGYGYPEPGGGYRAAEAGGG